MGNIMTRAARAMSAMVGRLKARGFHQWKSPQEMMEAARQARYPRNRMQTPKRQTRYDYNKGPMYWLGQQMVKGMEDAGYPAKIYRCYRDPELQLKRFNQGRSKARPFQSPHQYFEAVDIISPSMPHWPPREHEFWKTLRAVGQTVADKYGVELVFGHDWGWDSAHIELKDWRKQRDRIGHRVPKQAELWARFQQVLPGPAKQHLSARVARGGETPQSVADYLSKG